jgi:D-tyrosyl-tRNA(Tyr) deacylase
LYFHIFFSVVVAVTSTDTEEIMKWFCNKIINLRIFHDEEMKMNRSVQDIKGGILLISNFTLYGDAKRGFRPSFSKAAVPEFAEPMYDRMVEYLGKNYSIKIETGKFGAMMDVSLVNDGPVTIIIQKESGE